MTIMRRKARVKVASRVARGAMLRAASRYSESITPPSTRNAAPVVADACGDAT